MSNVDQILNKLFFYLMVLLLVLNVGGCGSDSDDSPASEQQLGVQIPAESLIKVLQTNAKIAYNVYSDALEAAQELKTAIDNMLANPNDTNLAAAKTAWLQAREPYVQTEVYRFRLGPIDSSNGVDEDGPEGRINAWPLAEGLIDYVAVGTTVDGVDRADIFPPVNPALSTNAIADSGNFPVIDKDTIATLNEADEDEANVATGYHAIEFLLWGQDLYNDPIDTEWSGINGDNRMLGGGYRPVTDYNTSAGNCTSGVGNIVNETICIRRGQYLLAAVELLIDDLQGLVNAWDPAGSSNHYADFVAGGESSLGRILESMGRLGFGELAGERMNIALEQDSQEDEHSCFSDNTHRDIVLDEQGIANSFFGTYLDTDQFDSAREVSANEGMGIDELLELVGLSSEANTLRNAILAAQAAVQVINEKATRTVAAEAFDMQIAPANTAGKMDVRTAIDALVIQTDAIAAVITALELQAGDLKQDTEEEI